MATSQAENIMFKELIGRVILCRAGQRLSVRLFAALPAARSAVAWLSTTMLASTTMWTSFIKLQEKSVCVPTKEREKAK
jgi:hypothetical protein